MLFIDDCTRTFWIYFLRSKEQVFDVFNGFKAMVELQSWCRLKAIRSDNGKEYASKEFQNFGAENGIQHQLTVS